MVYRKEKKGGLPEKLKRDRRARKRKREREREELLVVLVDGCKLFTSRSSRCGRYSSITQENVSRH